jgi:hypothetical protein
MRERNKETEKKEKSQRQINNICQRKKERTVYRITMKEKKYYERDRCENVEELSI